MRCRFVKKIYKNDGNGYCVFQYQTDEKGVPREALDKNCRESGAVFSATGYELPDKKTVETDLCGKWVRNPKYGLQLSVETYSEVRPQSEAGIREYLASGMIRGIGPRTAELIVQRFGTKTFDVLDNYPDSLLDIKGITESRLQTILKFYQGSRALRNLAAYLAPFKISPGRIQKIYDEYGSAAIDKIQNSPFELCRIPGFGFVTVDEIAKANRCSPDDPLRITGCVDYCMELEMQDGNLYQDKQILLDKVYEKLNHGYPKEAVSMQKISGELYRMIRDGVLQYDREAVYTAKAFAYEQGTAELLAALLVQNQEGAVKIDFLLEEAQRELSIRLSEKQEEAVKKTFASMISIITGGPGTGKTTVEKVLLYIDKKLEGSTVMLVAPTGRASRRMAESTGFEEACTMHSALGLTGDENTEYAVDTLEADFIGADEFSMVDMMLGYEFFSRIRKGTRLVLIGDVNQLPSVGPGSVFRELIQCGAIPVTVLDTVFRQEENGNIVMNAHRMLKNNAALEYGNDFQFYAAHSAEEAAAIVERLYMEQIRLRGIARVQVITPYRKRGAASVNAINERFWELVNPKEVGKKEIKAGSRIFRIGDKILHRKNKNGISNGDSGFVTDIYQGEDGAELARLEFSNGRFVEYDGEELDMVEHAYAMTVHKSQGSEYPVVILPWIPMFYKMLRRDILYTAVTRASEQVIIVGDKRSIYKAVHNTESDRRKTKLGERILREYNRLLEERKADVFQTAVRRESYEQLAIDF